MLKYTLTKIEIFQVNLDNTQGTLQSIPPASGNGKVGRNNDQQPTTNDPL
ncbi:hypothetical protein ACOWPH_06075 [Anabaena sp. PCC 7938]|nr:hypothetical protein [Anabaena sp. CCAP 1446/1C]MBY5281544.1 hypothetical protein [Anabaena sp. CCAP 1446/1C]